MLGHYVLRQVKSRYIDLINALVCACPWHTGDNIFYAQNIGSGPPIAGRDISTKTPNWFILFSHFVLLRQFLLPILT